MKPSPEAIDQRLVRALAHPLRIQILEVLTERVASPNLLADELDSGLSHVAYHTRALDRCGCLELSRHRTASRRHRAFLQGDPRRLRRRPRMAQGATLDPRRGIRGYPANLPRQGDRSPGGGTLDGRDDTVFRWMPLFLDEEGWKEVVAILEEATNLALAAHLRSQDRLTESGGRGGFSSVIGMACFETAGSLRT